VKGGTSCSDKPRRKETEDLKRGHEKRLSGLTTLVAKQESGLRESKTCSLQCVSVPFHIRLLVLLCWTDCS
jgi:hypothetical protein